MAEEACISHLHNKRKKKNSRKPGTTMIFKNSKSTEKKKIFNVKTVSCLNGFLIGITLDVNIAQDISSARIKLMFVISYTVKST